VSRNSRRLPLRSSVVVSPFAPGYIAPTDTSPDAKYQTHHNLYYNQSTAITLQTTSTTTCLQPSGCRRPPQPVYSHQAADDLRNLSTAIRLQTTSATCLQPSGCRRPPQPVYSHQAADDLRNLSTAIKLQTTSATCLQPSSCRRPSQPVYSH